MQCLVSAYNEPHRKYHSIQHLTECLVLLSENLEISSGVAEIEVALWFHDAIYSVRRSDNELQSAEWAVRELQQAGVASERIARVKEHVLATRHTAPPQGQDQMLLVDIDLAILGASRIRFEEYERQVREEYGWIPEFIYRRKRREVLSAFLSRNAIYNTPLLHEVFENTARANLAYSLHHLGG